MSGSVSSRLSALNSIQELVNSNLVILDAKYVNANYSCIL